MMTENDLEHCHSNKEMAATYDQSTTPSRYSKNIIEPFTFTYANE
jgi:hypothetical protein